MVYGYIRVSTNKQTLKNQKYTIINFARHQNIKVDRWIKEVISGTVSYEKRLLGNVIAKMGKNDILLCSEISRLGRNILQVMTILNICMRKEIQVWTIKENYRLGADIQSKVLAFAFSLAAEIERNLISQRTKEALKRVQADGRKLGREIGSSNKRHRLDGKEAEIQRLLSEGYSKRAISRIFGVSVGTICNVISKNQPEK